MDTDLDTEPVVLEDLDFAPTCDWVDCEKEAEWSVLLTCGCAGVICEKHRRVQETFDRDPYGAQCNRCGTFWVHVVRWGRL